MTLAVAPTARLAAEALTDTPVTVAVGVVTVMLTVPLCPLNVPVIVAVPAATAVTAPDDDTVATPGLLDDQVGLTVAEVPSL